MGELIGNQFPRLSSVPEGDAARGDEAVAFARFAGLTLYPWQEDLLRDMCRTRDDGLWAAPEVVVPLARQNGKGEVLVARELCGVYLFGEKNIFHSAHFMDTAIDAQSRLWEVIEGNDDLMHWWSDETDELPMLVKTNGKEAITFPYHVDANGRRVKPRVYFRTRTKKTARGLSIDLLIFDECFDLPLEVFAAMNSVTAARENAQKVFISSPVNRFEHMHGAIFSAKRWAGIDGAEGVLFKEWSIEDGDDPHDFESWKKANPSLVDSGPGVQLDQVRAGSDSAKNSQDLLDIFKVETLGAGNWYPRDNDELDFEPIVEISLWDSWADYAPEVTGEMAMAVDLSPDGSRAGLVAAVRRTDGGIYLSRSPLDEVEADAIAMKVKRAVDKNDPLSVALDPKGPASTLIKPLERLKIEADLMGARKVVAAYEKFLALLTAGKISHDGNPLWVEELNVAEERTIGEIGRALTRRAGSVVGLVAATFAVWALEEFEIPSASNLHIKKKKRPVGAAKPVAATASVSSMKF